MLIDFDSRFPCRLILFLVLDSHYTHATQSISMLPFYVKSHLSVVRFEIFYIYVFSGVLVIRCINFFTTFAAFFVAHVFFSSLSYKSRVLDFLTTFFTFLFG